MVIFQCKFASNFLNGYICDFPPRATISKHIFSTFEEEDVNDDEVVSCNNSPS